MNHPPRQPWANATIVAAPTVTPHNRKRLTELGCPEDLTNPIPWLINRLEEMHDQLGATVVRLSRAKRGDRSD